MRRRVVVALMFLLSVVTAAQTAGPQAKESTCSAALARSLTIRGIHLGMSADEVLALFPGARERADISAALAKTQNPQAPDFGVGNLYFQSSDFPGQARFKDVESFQLTLFDGRLVQWWVNYVDSNKGPYWPNVDDWVAKVSEAFNLPAPKEWATENMGTKRLKCDPYEIQVSLNGGRPAILVFDSSYVSEVQARVKAAQEKKRREFKP